MKFSKLLLLAAMVIVLSATGIYAQGRGGGRGGGGGMGGSMGGGRPTMSPGIDRGIDMSSDKSMGRSDRGRTTASDRSNGRSDNGNTARNVPTDNELNRFRGIAKKLGTTPQGLRSQFLAAQVVNPNLKFGQFISANVVASNLHRRFPNVTTAAILTGLDNGHSLGQTLQNLGVGSDAAKTAMKNAKEEIRDSENH